MGKRELVALLYLSSWCLMMVEWLSLAVPLGCLRFVIVVFRDHNHLLFFLNQTYVVETQKKVEHPQHMFKLTGKKIITILHSKYVLI